MAATREIVGEHCWVPFMVDKCSVLELCGDCGLFRFSANGTDDDAVYLARWAPDSPAPLACVKRVSTQ